MSEVRYNGAIMKEQTQANSFFKDRTAMLLGTVNAGLIVANVLSVFLRLRPSDFKIPVQYIVYDGTVVQTGNWFSLYSLVLFSAVGGVISLLLAYRLYKSNRHFAIAVMVVYSVLAVFSLLSINALLGLVERV